jgi:hypothetical protein
MIPKQMMIVVVYSIIYVRKKHGVSIKTCLIADMKKLPGLPKRVALNRINMNAKSNPCPEDKKELITEAFKYLEMI